MAASLRAPLRALLAVAAGLACRSPSIRAGSAPSAGPAAGAVEAAPPAPSGPGTAGPPAGGGRGGGGDARPDAAPSGAGADGTAQTAAAPAGPWIALFGGDLMLPPQIQDVAEEHGEGDAAEGYAWLLREIGPVRRRLEALGRTVFVANLESPVATERVPPVSSPPTFNGPREALEGFRRAGVDFVTMANNHAYDQEREGIAETFAAAVAAGLVPVGAGPASTARKPVVLSDSGPRVLLLAYAMTARRPRDPPDESDWRTATLDDRVEAEVRAARADADVLFVAVHWIGEFVSEPLEGWEQWARNIAAWGADAVVCHGPHVVGPVEIVDADGRAVPVVYSLGNLVANMGWEVHPGADLRPTDDSEMRIESREEALAALRVERSDPDAAGVSGTDRAAWTVTGLWIVPLWLEDNRPIANGRGLPREIFPRPMPWCVPDPADGCFDGADAAWCSGRLAMILERRAAAFETLRAVPPAAIEPCPAGANAYDPAPEFRPAGGGPD